MEKITTCKFNFFNQLGVCRNIHDDTQCDNWASRAECIKNPSWMRRNCAKACRSCNEMDMDVFDEDDDDDNDDDEEEKEEENNTNNEDTSNTNTNTGNDRDTNVGRREDVDVDDGKYMFILFVCFVLD